MSELGSLPSSRYGSCDRLSLQNTSGILKKFEEAGIDVIVVGSATSFEDVYSNIEMIGEATGSKTEAEEIITDMKERLQAIKDKAAEVSYG